MKRVFIILAIVLFGCDFAALAQIPVQHSTINYHKGKRYVSRFQRALGQHPGSYLVKARGNNEDGIADYLLGTYATLENAYLHIYFGARNSNASDTNLVITGALLTTKSDGTPTLQHDKAKSGIWITPKHEPNACLPYDRAFDFLYCDKAQNCDISDCGDGVSDAKTAKSYIANFQRNDGNRLDCCKPLILTTESFLLSANDIRAYLKEYPEVEYLQFYVGYKGQERFDNLTVLVVGVDKVGHHIWDFDESHYISMFNEAIPCPTCNVVDDRSIDYHRQSGAQPKCVAQNEN